MDNILIFLLEFLLGHSLGEILRFLGSADLGWTWKKLGWLSVSGLFPQRRKLDAVYYYMRSLAASNPILTAKESLMSLFEETKRKVSGDAGRIIPS